MEMSDVTKNGGLAEVAPLKTGYFGYPGIHLKFQGCK